VKKNTPWRALLSVLAVAAAASIAAGCGSGHISVDKKNAQRVAAFWLGESDGPARASCREHVCEIAVKHSFVDASEAWLLAVPVTTYRGPDFPGVNRIVLRITDKRRGQAALFSCSVRKAPPITKHSTDVSDAHRMCTGSVAASDS